MARPLRENGATMTQNVGLKGLNDQNMFFDDEDREYFLESMEKAKKLPEMDVEVPVWALMDNHVHMLIHGDKNDIARFFQSIGGRYGFYFNNKYERKGSIWTDRYYGKPIDTLEEYQQVAAYIFNNPVAAELAEALEESEWTSFKKVESGEEEHACEVIDELVGVEQLVEFTRTYSQVKLEESVKQELEPFRKERLFDKKAVREVKEIVSEENLARIPQLTEEMQRRVLAKLQELGASLRQIRRVTGLTRVMIGRLNC